MSYCLHCNKRLGWLKRPVDGVYCGPECRDRAIEEMLERQRLSAEEVDAEERMRERERLEIEAAMLRGKSEVIVKPNLSDSVPCPKCGGHWKHVRGGGGLGRDRGDCTACGYHTDFMAIEQCPNCRCFSLVVESQDDARCPRCKSRPRRRRQIA